jgi:hypothetical protein
MVKIFFLSLALSIPKVQVHVIKKEEEEELCQSTNE